MRGIKRFLKKHWRLVAFDSAGGIIIVFLVAFAISYFLQSSTLKLQLGSANSEKSKLAATLDTTQKSLKDAETKYIALKNEDQYKINQQLKKDVEQTHNSYKTSIDVFEKIQDLKVKKQKTESMELLYASAVKNLADLKFASADAQLADLNGQIKKINDELAAAAAAAAAAEAAKAAGLKNPPTTTTNTPPGSGYSYQMVKSDVGDFAVSIVSADLGSTRVIVDTATDGDCRDNCPVLSLGDYVARNGAFAGINGSYFCPASYPSCAGKTNSFDTLVMNKNKKYINSDNNVYSNVPVAVFGSGYARFLGASSGWGRDTGVNGVIANQPLLLSGGNIAFGGGSDPKQGSKGSRSFVGSKGSTVYLGSVIKKIHVKTPQVSNIVLQNGTHQWNCARGITALLGLLTGISMFLPVVIILNYVGREDALGLVQSVSAIISGVILYTIARSLNTRYRVRMIGVSVLTFFVAASSLAFYFNPTGIFIFVALLTIAQQLLFAETNSVILDLVDRENADHDNKYMYVFDLEMVLNVGRVTSIMFFVFYIKTFSVDFAMQYTPLFFAIAMGAIIFLARIIEERKEVIADASELAETYVHEPQSNR